jgi:ligand-binding sensor domain-containing protein
LTQRDLCVSLRLLRNFSAGTVNGPERVADDFIRILSEDNEGDLWIGMRSGGLGRWRDTRIVPFGPTEGLAGSYATTVAADQAGNLWLGTWRGGLYRLKDGKPQIQPTPLPTLYSTIRALAIDRFGHQWIGNWEGLYEFNGHRYNRFAMAAGSPYRRVSALLFDTRGGLWIGTADQGVFHFPGGRPTGPIPNQILPDSQITPLHQDTFGTLWLTDSGSLSLSKVIPGSASAASRAEMTLPRSDRRVVTRYFGIPLLSLTNHLT